MARSKILDILTSLPVSRSILTRAVCFATSRPANHTICSFIDLSGYASGPIRRCLFIDYIIIHNKKSTEQRKNVISFSFTCRFRRAVVIITGLVCAAIVCQVNNEGVFMFVDEVIVRLSLSEVSQRYNNNVDFSELK